MKRWRVISVMGIVAVLVLAMHQNAESTASKCDRHELRGGLTNIEGLPILYNDLFATSGRCGGCHAWDPNGVASVDTFGNDINLTEDWRSTMMANSAKDPFWKAKVSHEGIVNPGHAAALEHKCTSCHAPLGHFNALHNGQTYSMADLAVDTIGLDGVSCGACHQLDTTQMGLNFSGELAYDTNRVVYGPYTNPYSSPMELLIGFSLEATTKTATSELCAGCHTLITQTVDLTGNYTGNDFVEQATYHEWLNSQYSQAATEVTCQGCHMPRVDEGVILSIDYEFVGGRSPFYRHFFVGANTFMLRLIKNNFDSTGIYPMPALYDTTIKRTEEILQKMTLDMDLAELNRTADTVFYELELTNKAGHKFPSGYPSRRAFVQFVVMDDQGDTLFASGNIDDTNEVVGHDMNYEPHYQTIREENQVQIYEMVMADVNGDKTTVLERADVPLKDNRLVPKGFTMSHNSYDTTMLAGQVLNDPDFNNATGTEGSGTDHIYFNIPLNGYTGNLNTIANVYYQTAPPAWMTEMFSVSSPEIDRFKWMYENEEGTPLLVGSINMGDMWVGASELTRPEIKVYPNPTADGRVYLDGDLNDIQDIEVIDMRGRKVQATWNQINPVQIDFEGPSGTYVIIVHYDDGRRGQVIAIKR